MKHKNIIDIAYSFFPKGIGYDLPSYRDTIESQHLISILKENEINNTIWFSFLSYLSNQEFVAIEVGKGSVNDRCFQIGLVNKFNKESKQIVLCISKIVPFYCFYTYNSLTFDSFHVNYKLTENFSKIEIENIDKIIPFLKNFFPEYSHINYETLNIELENIEFEDLGKLSSQKEEIIYRKMTIFNSLFSSFVYY